MSFSCLRCHSTCAVWGGAGAPVQSVCGQSWLPPCPPLKPFLELPHCRIQGWTSSGLSPGLPCGSVVKSLPAVQETRVPSLDREDPLEEGLATRSSVLAWRIPWTEEPGGLQSVGPQRVRHACLTEWQQPVPSSPHWLGLAVPCLQAAVLEGYFHTVLSGHCANCPCGRSALRILEAESFHYPGFRETSRSAAWFLLDVSAAFGPSPSRRMLWGRCPTYFSPVCIGPLGPSGPCEGQQKCKLLGLNLSGHCPHRLEASRVCSKCAHDSSLVGVPAQGAEGPVCCLQDVQVQRNPRQPVFPLLFSEHKFLHQFILKQTKKIFF